MISENFQPINGNGGPFSLGSKSSSSKRCSKTKAIASKKFRKEIPCALTKDATHLTSSQQFRSNSELLSCARELIACGNLDGAEAIASDILSLDMKELIFMELAEVLFKGEEFQRADAMARRISSPALWERVLSIFLEFRPAVIELKKSTKKDFHPALRQLDGPPLVAGKNGSFGAAEILTNYCIPFRDQNIL